MSSSATIRAFLLAALGVTCVICVTKVKDMGPCHNLCKQGIEDFDFDKFATEKGGSWKYQLVPKLEFFNPIESAGVQYTPTGIEGVYDLNIYNILKSGKTETFSDGRVTYLGNGRAINNATTETGAGYNIFQYVFLKYVENKFLYYYVCTRGGADNSTDYRNVLVHEQLDDETIESLIKLDKKYKFKNDLQTLKVKTG